MTFVWVAMWGSIALVCYFVFVFPLQAEKNLFNRLLTHIEKMAAAGILTREEYIDAMNEVFKQLEKDQQ